MIHRGDLHPEDIYVQLMPLVKVGREVLRIIHVVQQDLKNIVRNHLLKVRAKREKLEHVHQQLEKFANAKVDLHGFHRPSSAVHGVRW